MLTTTRGWRAWLVASLGMVAFGCQEPKYLVPAAPPGVDTRALMAPKEEGDNGPQAIGESAASGADLSKPHTANLPDIPPALPTAKGETKTTQSGVKYETLKEGTGAVAKLGQRLSVHYTGTLEDGRKFDSSHDRGQPFAFTPGVDQVITGWNEAIPGMKIGERRKLIVPPNAGYGAQGYQNSIPPNATLIFDVELIDVK